MKKNKSQSRSTRLGSYASGVYLAAQGIKSGVFDQFSDIFGGSPDSPAQAVTWEALVGLVLQILLMVAGSIAVIFLVIGGFRYITAYGNEEQTESAKKTITSSLLGLVIILLSFAVVRIITEIVLRGAVATGT